MLVDFLSSCIVPIAVFFLRIYVDQILASCATMMMVLVPAAFMVPQMFDVIMHRSRIIIFQTYAVWYRPGVHSLHFPCSTGIFLFARLFILQVLLGPSSAVRIRQDY